MISLFSYGTLQQRAVQLATYGRALDGEPDALIGYRLEAIEIDDPDVVAVSGRAVHTVAHPTASSADRIQGMVFLLNEAELAATDGYETDAYARTEVTLESGRRAFVYVAASTGRT